MCVVVCVRTHAHVFVCVCVCKMINTHVNGRFMCMPLLLCSQAGSSWARIRTITCMATEQLETSPRHSSPTKVRGCYGYSCCVARAAMRVNQIAQSACQVWVGRLSAVDPCNSTLISR